MALPPTSPKPQNRPAEIRSSTKPEGLFPFLGPDGSPRERAVPPPNTAPPSREPAPPPLQPRGQTPSK